jgi:hypothetical protein
MKYFTDEQVRTMLRAAIAQGHNIDSPEFKRLTLARLSRLIGKRRRPKCIKG